MELLVAIALLAIATVLAYRGLDGIQRADARAKAEAARWQAIAAFVDRFHFDVGQPSARPVRRGALEEPAWLAAPRSGGAGDELWFTRKPVGPGQDEKRLGYRLHDNTIELLSWPALDSPDAGPPPAVHGLLDGVRGLELRYLAADGRWLERWPGGFAADALPRAVRLHLVMADGTDLSRTFALP